MRERTRETETVGPSPEGTPAPPLAPGTRLAGRYRLGDVLGVGGYGVVYRAIDGESGEEVAVKALRAERLSDSVRQRLRREALLLDGLEHPHLVKVFAAGEADGVAYLTMELVEGETLRERLGRGPLPLAEAVRIARELLSGLAALHARGIVHRDVKPGNVLLDGAARAKLADFGLVRRFEAEATWATSSLAVIGTAEYLSPEQALGAELDGRSDLYALGVLLFEMLSGRPVHEPRSTFALVLAHLDQPAPDVRELRADVPLWLAGVVERLLEKNRERRYGSAREALSDLERQRMPRDLRRRRLVRSGLVALGVAALAGALAAGWGFARSRAGFNHVGHDATGAAVALDRAGRVLWRKEGDWRGRSFVALQLPGGRRAVASILAPADVVDPAARHRLSLLDAQSGAEIDHVVLPDVAPRAFAGLSNRFLWTLHPFDIDGDGIDEVYVAYCHESRPPSYVVAYDPARRRSQTLFVAAGHHRPSAAVDVDGDGRRELLLLGTASRIGWSTALAAVRVPGNGEAESTAGPDDSPPTTPDVEPLGGSEPLWYALLPPGTPRGGDAPLEIDEAQRRLRVVYGDGRVVEVGFDGFLADASKPQLPVAGRTAARARAYAAMRQADRQLAAGMPAEAEALARETSARATEAGDRPLAEWGERIRVRALVAAGAHLEADRLASSLAVRSAAGLAVAMEAAQAFHLAGDLERALGWYERGLADSDRRAVARRCGGYLEGTVLVLAELGRWNEIPQACRRAEEVDPAAMGELGRTYEAWARWRSGQPPAETRLPAAAAEAPEFVRLLRFELAAASGEAPEKLLAAVERERASATETSFLLLSLRSELLARLGRSGEALADARAALAEARRRAPREIHARAFLADLDERARRLEQLSRSPRG